MANAAAKTKKAKLTAARRSGSAGLTNRFGIVATLVLVILLVTGGVFIYISRHGNSGQAGGGNNGGSGHDGSHGALSMYLVPSSQQLKQGDNLTIAVTVNSGSNQANAVQAVLKYPVDKLAYVSSDASGSRFTVEAEASDKDGKVTLARGSTTPLSGEQLVAKVTFKALSSSGRADLAIDASSQLLSSGDNKNILKDISGGSYRLSE